MKRALFILLACLAVQGVLAQKNKDAERARIVENRIELIAEDLEAEEIDFTTLFDELSYFFDHPINLNSTTKEELSRLHLLSDFQINNLLYHREKTGKLISFYELQGVDGFDLETIFLVRPFVKVSDQLDKPRYSLSEILEQGKSEWLFRYITIAEDQLGYSPIDDSTLQASPNRRYLGGKERLYTRYRFRFGNKISIGFTADKDAGEEFFTGSQTNGFDFYSAHFFIRDLGLGSVGRIKKLMVGDYQLQFGQGLTAWSGLAFGKSSDILNIKRNGAGIRPYTAADENLFLRGVATTVAVGPLEVTPFYSDKQIDGNLTNESLEENEEEVVVTSLQRTGFHRTPGELQDKDAIGERHYGGRIAWKSRSLDLGATYVRTEYDGELQRNLAIYNQFDFNNNENRVMGFDANYVFRNFNVFGEVAQSQSGGWGYTAGLVAALDPRLNVTILHRHFDRDFQSQLSNGISEASRNQNETGTYIGMVARPLRKWTLSAYYDQFQFPWLRFLVNAPSRGVEYLVQLEYKPSKVTSAYVRYREETKGRNNRAAVGDIPVVSEQNRAYLRFQFSHKPTGALELRSRAEFSRYQLTGDPEQRGSMLYQDVIYKPKSKPYSFAFRYALFDTDGFDSRIFAYENDVLYFFSVPALSNRGNRTYLLVKYRVNRNLDAWVRVAQTYFTNIDEIGSGLDVIEGNTRTEIKAQIRLKF